MRFKTRNAAKTCAAAEAHRTYICLLYPSDSDDRKEANTSVFSIRAMVWGRFLVDPDSPNSSRAGKTWLLNTEVERARTIAPPIIRNCVAAPIPTANDTNN